MKTQRMKPLERFAWVFPELQWSDLRIGDCTHETTIRANDGTLYRVLAQKVSAEQVRWRVTPVPAEKPTGLLQ